MISQKNKRGVAPPPPNQSRVKRGKCLPHPTGLSLTSASNEGERESEDLSPDPAVFALPGAMSAHYPAHSHIGAAFSSTPRAGLEDGSSSYHVEFLWPSEPRLETSNNSPGDVSARCGEMLNQSYVAVK